MKPRRTQAERRAATIAKLVQATIESMHDVGYSSTTVKEVCSRAGVSQGGLFRHFSTRLDLIVAAADEVALRQAQAFQLELDQGGDPIEAAVRAARARCHSPINAVWHELMVACRTDPELRAAVEPAATRYRAAIEELASGVLATALPQATVSAAAWYVIHCFDGEAIGGTVLGDPAGTELRVAWIAQTLRRLLVEQAQSA